MAICMAYRSKGMSMKRSAWYAFLSNLPQPLSALASFGCMKQFAATKLALPIGLGMASGAMCYVVFYELAPEALEKLPSKRVRLLMAISGFVVLILDAHQHFHDWSAVAGRLVLARRGGRRDEGLGDDGLEREGWCVV